MHRHQLTHGLPVMAGSSTAVDLTRYMSAPTSAQACADGGDSATMTSTGPSSPAAAAAPLDLEALAGVTYPDVSQGALNMCTSMAFAHAFALVAALQGGASAAGAPPVSPLFAYYYQRVQECKTAGLCKCPKTGVCDPPCLDCGSLLSSAEVVFKGGVPPLAVWPLAPQAVNTTPSPAAQAQALTRRLAVQTTACLPPGDVVALTRALAARTPVVIFWNVSANVVQWMGAQSRVAGMHSALGPDTTAPAFDPTSTPILGHAVLVVGIQGGSPEPALIVRNSFGNAWGANGRFLLPWSQYTSQVIHGAVAVVAVTAA